MTASSDMELFGRTLPLAPSAAPQRRKCRICQMFYVRPRDAEVTICGPCADDVPGSLALVEAQIAAVARRLGDLPAAWVERQAELPDDLSKRWAALVIARDSAERAVATYERGNRSAGAPDALYAQHLDDASATLRSVRAKIARTAKADSEIAALLDEERAYRAAMKEAYHERARWEMARSDLEIVAGEIFP